MPHEDKRERDGLSLSRSQLHATSRVGGGWERAAIRDEHQKVAGTCARQALMFWG